MVTDQTSFHSGAHIGFICLEIPHLSSRSYLILSVAIAELSLGQRSAL